MKIHEYQAKQILSRFGVPVPKGFPVETPEDAVKAARELGTPVVAVKAQIHAGGRGKGGGVKIAKSPEQAGEIARAMLGMMLVTPQTGPGGQKVRRLLVEEGTDIRRETYVGVVLDRVLGLPVAMACAEGGMSIEELARDRPEAILREPLDPDRGLLPFRAGRLARGLGLEGASLRKGQAFLQALCRAYLATDATLAEINPLVTTGSGEVIALDAKINFDDNALFRHKDIEEMRDPHEENPAEARAAKFELSYVALDGNIGCMVNGAGLAMSTMDIIKHHGGEPANFLDVGGGATLARVTEGFRIILEDPKVRAILVNIFGGIMKCDVIAEGVVGAARELGLRVPLVVRLEGTNVEKGRKILADSGLNLIPAGDMTEAASRVVAAAGEVAMAVLVGKNTRVVVQGITGAAGSFHAKQCLEYGTKIVAGATPGKGGTRWEDRLPVFDSVAEAVAKEGADCALIFVPPPFAADAIEEAACSGVKVVLCITEGIPTLDMIRAMETVRRTGVRLVGPNCPGVITPGEAKIGIMPGYIHKPGRVGVVSRSGTLTYESVWQLSARNIGQSTCIGLGGDPVNGTNFVDALRLFEADPGTDGVVMIGEIGGSAEEDGAEFIRTSMKKPVAAFIAGATAPPGRRMGHAGALISGGKGTAAAKKEALRAAGARVADSPADMGAAMADLLRERGLLPAGAK